MVNILGYQLKPTNFMQRCDFDGPNHNPVIPAGKTCYVVKDGEAKGKYHSPSCYQAALSKYQSIKKETGVITEADLEE